jgi:glycosyltransferase involved in cell wall biosynthesis
VAEHRPLEVLHVITRLIVGGAQENTLETALLLDPDRFRATILTGPEAGPEGSLIEEGRRRGAEIVVEPALRRALHPGADAVAFLRLARRIRRGAFDVVHTHSSKAGILGRWAARWVGTPLVVHTVHGWSFHAHQPAWQRSLFVALERSAARCADRLVAVSERDVGKGLAAGIGSAAKYTVVRSAIDMDCFRFSAELRSAARSRWRLPEDVPVVGTVTRLSPQKDPLSFVEAAARVARAHPRVHFVVVGDGPLREAAGRRAAALGLGERILWLGLRRDVAKILSGLDLFVLTSLWEGLPRALVQAMATGLPVVASAVDGNAELVEDGVSGRLVPPGRPEEAARAINELLAAPVIRAQMGQAAALRVREEFSHGRMLRALEAVYETASGRA